LYTADELDREQEIITGQHKAKQWDKKKCQQTHRVGARIFGRERKERKARRREGVAMIDISASSQWMDGWIDE
jgi:hypothetical protein